MTLLGGYMPSLLDKIMDFMVAFVCMAWRGLGCR